jgi:hypothetical protein
MTQTTLSQTGRFLMRIVLMVVLCCVLSGCRKKKVVTCQGNQGYDPKLGICYDCPSGTKVDYGTATCIPVAEGDASDSSTPEDVRKDDGISPDATDSDPDELPADNVADSELLDVQHEDVVPPGSVGSACNMNTDCEDGLSCFDWPSGYCILPDCGLEVDCPEGSECLPLMQNAQACFDQCEGDLDCRPGYGCKSIATIGGEARSVCHPVNADPAAMGEECTEHAECVGNLACVKLGPKAMCTKTGCSTFEPCPETAACLPWGIMTICLPFCETDAECMEMAGSELFTCQDLEDIVEKDQQVCSAAQQGLPVGELCFFSTECLSGYCHLLIAGFCSGPDGSECGTDQDCTEGFCIPNPGIQKGICSYPCGPADPCAEGTYCGMTGDGPMCLASCDNFGDPCGPDGFQMVCTYGTLYYPPAPSGKYACAKALTGEAGASCKKDEHCSSGICYGAVGGDGYCATSCVTDKDCSFGALCLQDIALQGQTHCVKLCFGDIDCPAGFTCKNTFSQEKACQL